MFNFGKRKQPQSGRPITVHLLDAQKRSEPTPFTLNATDIAGLLMEVIQLAKLKATEKRDLEAIRSDYLLKNSHLEQKHKQAMEMIKEEYAGRKQMIEEISILAKQMIDRGQYEIGYAIINRMLDIIAKESPLQKVMDMQNKQRFT